MIIQCLYIISRTWYSEVIAMLSYGTIIMFVLFLGPLKQVPKSVSLTNVASGQLTFTWNTVNSTCPSLNYDTSSNCTNWTCVVTTDTTSAICSGLQLPSVCTFTVQTEVCGQVGLPSEPITVKIRGMWLCQWILNERIVISTTM